MENREQFRVPVILKKNSLEIGRYLILATFTESGKVRELQDHIKNVLGITGKIKLKVENFILPENESIQIVHPEDIVVVDEVDAEEETRETIKKKRKIEGVGTVLSRLIEEKKTELLSALERVENTSPEEVRLINGSNVESVSGVQITAHSSFENSCGDLYLRADVKVNENGVKELNGDVRKEFVPPGDENDGRKRKRTRRRKKCSLGDLPGNDESHELSESSLPEKYPKPKNLDDNGKSTRKNHIYFNNEGEPDGSETNGILEVESQSGKKDWQAKLLHMTSLPREKKVFQRSLDPQEETEKSIELKLSDVKAGDILCFKVLVMENSCPVLSSEIVGKITSINEADESIFISITENQEALEEIYETSGGLTELRLDWSSVIQPHLRNEEHF